MYAFMQIPTMNKSFNRICLNNKQSILSNILKPTIYYDSLLSFLSPKDTVKNALILDIDTAIRKTNKVEKDLCSIKHDCTSEGHGIYKDILVLAE